MSNLDLDDSIRDEVITSLPLVIPERTLKFVVKNPNNSIYIKRDESSVAIKALSHSEAVIALYAHGPHRHSYIKVAHPNDCLDAYKDSRLQVFKH